jgi:protein-L-isoaspartate(D-aspartate) O-methyltransferase
VATVKAGRGLAERRGGIAAPAPDASTVLLLREVAEPVADLESADLGSLLERIGSSRVVLIGEATHGSSEFYRMRARITRELIQKRGFDTVTIEGDWPDAARVHRWTSGGAPADGGSPPFARFPTWMWRNRETSAFVGWLRDWNARRVRGERVGFYGLDLYSLYASIAAVLEYLDRVDPAAGAVARERYGCLTPWKLDPAGYGRAAVTSQYRTCEHEAVAMLRDLMARRLDYVAADGESYLSAMQNARLVADAERYYRIMYRGGHEAWNLRDRHMFETLRSLLAWRGENAKAVIWAHNSHVGDHRATEPGAEGQETVGGHCRRWLGQGCFAIGFGTDHGTVAAASDWDGPLEIKKLRPAVPESYESLCHATGTAGFLLHLREPEREDVRGELEAPRLERAVGVIYRPETELQSHYFLASLPHQFDEWIWFDETSAVMPLERRATEAGVPETFPFGL